MAQTPTWLIKSGGRILGPLDKKAVESYLRSKEIVPLDEASFSFGRWKYIRDWDEFDLVCNELKNKKSSGEATITHTESEATATDITERVGAFGNTERLVEGVKEQLSEAARIAKSQSQKSETKSYSFESDPVVEDQVQKSKANVLIAAAVVVVALGFTIKLITSRVMSAGPVSQTFEMLVNEAEILALQGKARESAATYRAALEKRQDSVNVKLDLAVQLLNIGQMTESRRLFEEILTTSSPSLVKAQALNGIAITYIKNFDLKTAQEKLDEVLKIDSTNYWALANKAAILFQDGKPVEAESMYLKALENGGNDPSLALLLVDVLVSQQDPSNKDDRLKKSKNVLNKLLELTQNWRMEALFYRYLVGVISGESNADEILKLALDTDPSMTEDHIQDPLIFKDRLNWDSSILLLKQNISNAMSSKQSLVAAVFQLRGREKVEGKKKIEEILTQSPDDKLTRAWLAYAQMITSREDEALANAKISAEGTNLILPRVVKARLCARKKDYLCAEESWKEVLEQNPNSLSGLVGLGEAFAAKGMKIEALKLLEKAHALSKRYAPASVMLSQLKQEGPK